MKTISATLQALWATRQAILVKLFQFTLIDGTVLNFCSGDQDVVVGGTTYSCGNPNGPFFETADNKAKVHFALGTSVDRMVFDVVVGDWKPEGFTFTQAVRYLLFDQAICTMSLLFMAGPGDTTAGAVPMFTGQVAQIDYSNSVAQFTIASHMELLNMQLPKNCFQAGCLNTLFDQACTLSQAAFLVTGTVSSGLTPGSYIFGLAGSAAGEGAGFFNLGRIVFTTGANAGQWRDVTSHVSGSPPVINVIPPYGIVPSAGDAFNIYPGCDKTELTCINKFNNKVNYRAMDFTPQVSLGV